MDANLPDLNQLDREGLLALLVVQHHQLLETQQRLASRESELAHLKVLIAKLQRLQFGRRSEKVQRQIEQLELRLEELEANKAAENTSDAPAAVAPTFGTKPRRGPLPEHLPREVRRREPKETVCPGCGGELRKIGEDVSEMLEYVPEKFKVIRQVRPKLSCAACERIVQAPVETRPIAHGMAGPGLLAHVLVSKYADHLPLYRQSEIYARQGVDLERSTLAGWVGATSELMAPLVEALRRYVFGCDKLHADDTPVPVLAPGTGKTKTGRLWTYVRDDRPSGSTDPPGVWFAYSPDRKGDHPQQHLRDFSGRLQADAYAGFNQLYAGAASRKSPAGRMCAASSTTWTRHTPHRWRRKPSSALESSTRLRARSAAVRRMNGEPRGRRDRNLCWTPCAHGSRAACRSYRASLTLPPRSVTRSHFGMLLGAI
jgi:transposase